MKYILKNFLKTVLFPFTRNFVYTTQYGGMDIKLKGGVRFLNGNHRHPSKEESFLSALNLKAMTIFDIGSHIGILSIFFAKSTGKKGHVVSFEPNPYSFSAIENNIKLNDLDNVKLFNIAVGDKSERRTLVFRPHDSGTGSMEKKIRKNMLKKRKAKSVQVVVDTLDSFIEKNQLPKPDFVKMDIEGMEYWALLGMSATLRKCKPSMYIEIHGYDGKSKSENIQKIVDFLDLYGYSIHHVESDQVVTSTNASIAKEGHIYCS